MAFWQPICKVSYWPFFAGQGHPVCWSNPMQTTGQVECKWVVKSMQLRTIEIGEVLAQVAQIKTSITAAQKVSGWNVISKVERVKQSLLPTR
ncbi:hypothetical protein [Pseudomonas sp. PS02303]|uniref:hypothetical protein n=1 Tax=Pseudomonas sp. PS02303 TaxID=2991429 RepID=UPI0032B3B6B7